MPALKSRYEGKKAPKASAAKSATTTKSRPEPFAGKEKMPATPEQRYQMIAEAAYYRAERRGFVGGDPARDWLEAEAEIDRTLQQQGKEARMTEKQAFQQRLEAQLREWDAKLEELKAKAQEAKAEILADYGKQLEALAGKRVVVQAKALELRQRTGDAWEDLKGSTEKTWDEMRKTLDRIASRFK